ncbi:MAG: hypothetical protein IJ019_03125 [Alphaproteobacteria bacterium]|nr:hypothetical protein [Alphaproteobacteria bacterium]
MNIVIVTLLLMFPVDVFAACSSDCVVEPTCHELGYRQNINCPNGYISCPLDPSYKWCKQYKCSDGRYNSQYTNEVGWDCEDVPYHGLSCLDCLCKAPSEFRWNSDNIGSGILSGKKACNGNYEKCYSPCVAADFNLPANAELITCTACGKTVKTGFKCKEGYTGSRCTTTVACPAGSATDAEKCLDDSEFISTNIKGYSGDKPCYECRSTVCETGTSQAYIDAELCGNSGGWTSRPTQLNPDCYECVAKTCSSDYQLQSSNCVTTGNKGYKLDDNDTCYEGNNQKHKCIPNGCNSGNDTSYLTVETCMNAKGYKSPYGVSIAQVSDDYDGETPCYKCTCKCGDEYKWTEENVGKYSKVDGTVCCNGTNYSDCSVDKDSFPTIEIPNNAKPNHSTFKICNETKEYEAVTGWECAMNYVRNYNRTSCIPCSIGSVYHADGNCTEYGSSNFWVKTFTDNIPPIGVVFQINDPNKGTAGRVVSLRDLKLTNSTPITNMRYWYQGQGNKLYHPYSGSSPMLWGGSSLKAEDLSDEKVNGKVATAKLIAKSGWSDNLTVPIAAMAAYYLKLPEYYDGSKGIWDDEMFLDGLKPGNSGILDWYLPSANELKVILAKGQTYFDNSTEPQDLTGEYYGLASQVTNTLVELANNEVLKDKYKNSLYDQIPAETMEGVYMSSSVNSNNTLQYQSVNVNSKDVEYVSRVSPNTGGAIKARAVLNFDKCPYGMTIYPNSSSTGSDKWDHHIGMKCQ